MKNKQGITIAALIVAIVGLSIGFAAFSNTLTVSQGATVDPSGTNMNVVWSSSNSDAETDPIVPTKSPNNVTGFTATSASITGADYRTLSSVSAAFTAPGQSVTYELYVYNNGTYTAYLTNLVMGSKTCAATPQQNSEDEATEELVSAACNDISMTVEIGTSELTASGSLENQTLAPGASVAATVTLTYANNNHYVDGPMTVTFGSTTFEASTVAAQVASSPVAGTYTSVMGQSVSQIVLNNDGTAILTAGGEMGQLTYTYDSTNSIVTLIMGEDTVPMTYIQTQNNKVLWTDMFGVDVLSTNGTTDLTPLSATYEAYDGTEHRYYNITFNTSGKASGTKEDEIDYIVLGNTIYFPDYDEQYYTTSDNFETLDVYDRGEFSQTITRQS